MVRIPRQLSVEYPGAICHLMSCGEGRKDLDGDDVDRQDFLQTLAQTCQKTEFQIHADGLMSNPFHLVVARPNANLVAGRKELWSPDTIGLHHRQQLFGQGFSGRYQALFLVQVFFQLGRRDS